MVIFNKSPRAKNCQNSTGKIHLLLEVFVNQMNLGTYK